MKEIHNINMGEKNMKFDDESETLFYENGPFWHLCTPGELSGILFRDAEDYVFGMNTVAVCAADYADILSIYTFQIMSNHFHFVVSGQKESAISFFNSLKKKLVRFFHAKYNIRDLRDVECNLYPVESLRYLRNLIAYVNRNGYLVNRNETPFSYRWGANGYIFNRLIYNEKGIILQEMPVSEVRKIFKTRDYSKILGFYLVGGYVSPLCYCKISLAEKMYRDANQYFNLVSRQVEAFSSMARELGDKIILTDDEMYSAVVLICKKEHNVEQPVQLDKEAKLRVAKMMHYNYNATNKQIKRILKLEDYIIESLFP